MGTVHSISKRATLGLDSGGEIAVWLPELFPEAATVESEESRRGVKYFGPGDWQATGQSQSWESSLQSSRCQLCTSAKNHGLALCSSMDSGHDVFFTHEGGCFGVHTDTERNRDLSSTGKFALDAESVLFSRADKAVCPSDDGGRCIRWKMVQSNDSMIEFKKRSWTHAVDESQ